MKTKNLFFFLSALAALVPSSAWGATVTWSMPQFFGSSNLNPAVTIYTRTGDPYFVGTNLYFSGQRFFPTDGYLAVSNLPCLSFSYTFDNVPTQFTLNVPNDTNTYNAINLTPQLAPYLPAPAFAAGTNIIATTNYQNGLITLNLSAIITNVPASEISGAPWLSTNDSRAVELSGDVTITDLTGGVGTFETLTISNGIFDTNGAYPASTNLITISGANDLDSLLISGNAIILGSSLGNGPVTISIGGSGTVPSNNLGGILPQLQNANGSGLTNLTATNLVGNAPSAIVAQILTNTGSAGSDPNTGYLTNFNSISYLYFPLKNLYDYTNYPSVNGQIAFVSGDSAHNSGNGPFFPLFGTNYNGSANVWKVYTNAQGVVETNYVQDAFALFVGMVPKQSGTSNGTPDVGNINKGAGTLFMNGEPFALGTIWSAAENDYFYQTNGVTYWLLFQTTNYDGQQDGFAKQYIQCDSVHGNILITNGGIFAVSANNFTVTPNGGISATSPSAGVTMGSASATFTNIVLTQPPSSSTDFITPISLGNGSWYIGFRKGANIQAQSLYLGDVNAVLLQMDENNGVYTYGTAKLSTYTETITNNLFLRTNSTTPPTPSSTGGWFWNSNNALYWVTTTHTNYITGP